MISFVPQGVGVVEAAVTVAFALFGIDSATGLAVVMVYRGIVFWLPFLVGAFVIQRMKAFAPPEKARTRKPVPLEEVRARAAAAPVSDSAAESGLPGKEAADGGDVADR